MLGFLFLFLIVFLLYGVPIAAVVFLIVSLINYFSAKKWNRKRPGEIGEGWLSSLRRRIVISGVIAAVLVTACIVYTLLFLNGVLVYM